MTRFPPSRVLVPVDFSEPSLRALEDAKDIARRFGASLDLLYVETIPLSLNGFQTDGEGPVVPALIKQMDEFRHWREEKMRDALEDFPKNKSRVRTLRGWPPAKIADLAAGRGPDLVVMGTHGYAGLDRALFGSVAEAVVRRAQAPVLTVHARTAKLRFSKILVPCNMTDYSDRALVYATKWARRFGARIGVLFVAPLNLALNEAAKVLRYHVESVVGKKAAARFELLIRDGDPQKEILETVARGRFELIVLSAHRKPFWSGVTLGSTAERILRHSPVPVLSIPSTEVKKRNLSKPFRPLLTDKIY